MAKDDRTGCNQRANCIQVTGVLVYLSTVAVFSGAVLPNIPSWSYYSSLLFYYVTALLVTLSWLQCAMSNPTDPMVQQQCLYQRLKKSYDTGALDYYCPVCNLFVSDNSKHCRTCPPRARGLPSSTCSPVFVPCHPLMVAFCFVIGGCPFVVSDGCP